MWTSTINKVISCWQKIDKRFTTFTEKGTHSITDEEFKYRAIQLNRIGSIITLLLASCLITFTLWLLREPIITYGILAYFVLTASSLLLSIKGHHTIAGPMLYLVQVAFILYFGRVLGQIQPLQFMIFFLLVINYQIFPKGTKRLSCNLLALGVLIALQFSYHFQRPLYNMQINYPWEAFWVSTIALMNVLIVLLCGLPIMRSREQSLKLQRANNLIKLYVAQITHELRSPLNAIHLAAKLLKKEVRKNTALRPVKPYADILLMASDNTRNTVNNVLDMARIEAGKTEPNTQLTFYIKPFFTRFIEMSEILAFSRKMKIRLLMDDMPSLIMADPLKLSHVMNNLLSNAIKYGTSRSTITVTIRKLNEEQWTIEVRNPVQSIAVDKLNTYFDPFVTGNDMNVTEGTGLGLYIVRQKVASMGGIIQPSLLDGQVVFTITLPLQVGKTKDLVDSDEDDDDLHTDLERARVLIAEDEAINATALELTLKNMNCEVIIARNGQEMLDMANDPERQPDIIIMDYHMPFMNGEVALRTLKSVDALKSIPVIVTTGDNFTDSIDRLLAAGADAFISKPVEPGPLRKLLSRHLHQQSETV